MEVNNCKTLIFSSSATIYSCPENKLIDENFPIKPINPYGHTKSCIETLLEDVYKSEKGKWKIINLRYFNPIGAHHSGLIGDNTHENPENIFPIICQVASGIRDKLYVYGNDWPTNDGTCHRDYIHVIDLAIAHKKAIQYLFENIT